MLYRLLHRVGLSHREAAGRWNAGSIGAVVLAFSLLAGSVSAVELRDVRIGVHDEYTRVVLETDGKLSYTVDSSDQTLVVHLKANGRAEAITRKSPHLIWVRVEPTGAGTDVRIQLKRPVELKELLLREPDRLVLDLYPAFARETATELPFEPEPKEAAPRQREPGPAPDLEFQPEDDDVLEEVLGAEAELGEIADPAAGTRPLGAEALAGDEEVGEEVGEEVVTAEVVPPPRLEEESVQETPEPEQAEDSGGLLGILSSPLVLAGLAVAFFSFILWRRRRAAEDDDFGRFGADDEGDVSDGLPAADIVVEDVTDASSDASAGDGSIFDVEADEVAAPESRGDLMGAGTDLPSIPVAAAAVGASSGLSDELERRMSLLETRLEELVDARERLERQVAAQTEELRVQRAAIARTQRVLRSVARPEDEATEPAPKA